MSDMENLWGMDFIPPAEEAVPKEILLEQARLLEKITDGFVFGSVESSQKLSGELEHSFRVFAPALKYSALILNLRHGAEMYPCTVAAPDVPMLIGIDPARTIGFTRECHSDIQLKAALREVLTHERTQKRIRALIAQAKAA